MTAAPEERVIRIVNHSTPEEIAERRRQIDPRTRDKTPFEQWRIDTGGGCTSCGAYLRMAIVRHDDGYVCTRCAAKIMERQARELSILRAKTGHGDVEQSSLL